MAASKEADSIDDFVNCHVCCCEYDAVVRKPKFLPCSHTVCIVCLRVIYRDGKISCPTCCLLFRQEPDSLSTNEYVLQLLKFKEQKTQKVNNISVKKLSTSDCTSSQHSSFNKGNGTAKQLDDFLSLREDFQRAKEEQLNKLPIAIEMRKNINDDLSLFKESATTVERELEKLQDENNIYLKELMNLNDSLLKMGNFLPELATFVDGPTSGETIHTLIMKKNKCRALCENKLQEAVKTVSEFKLCNETKVAIHLYDEDNRPVPTFDLFEKGFRLRTNRNQQDLKLISHLIFSILKKVNSPDEQFTPQEIAESSVDPFAIPAISSLPPVMPVSPNFILGQSVFSLWLMQSSKPIGSICIRPTPLFNPTFLQKLGDYCYHSPMTLPRKITKAVSGNYMFLPIIKPEFKELFKGVTDSTGSHQDSSEKATEMFDVGINFVTTLKNQNIVGWSFSFILEESSVITKRMIPTSDLFGRFNNYHVLEMIQQLSSISTGESNNYSLSLESS